MLRGQTQTQRPPGGDHGVPCLPRSKLRPASVDQVQQGHRFWEGHATEENVHWLALLLLLQQTSQEDAGLGEHGPVTPDPPAGVAISSK